MPLVLLLASPVLLFLHEYFCYMNTLAAAGIIIVPVAFCEVHLVATILCLLRILHREIGRLKSANMLWWRGQRAALSGLVGFGCWLVDKAAC